MIGFLNLIFTDHDTELRIAKQILLFIFSTDKLNFGLTETFKYLSKFIIKICHKPDKQYKVCNKLS